MIIDIAFKYRLYPTDEQNILMAQQAGNCRWLWNYYLDLNQKEYEKNQKFIFSHDLITLLPKLKQEKGKEWLDASFSQSLQQVARHFDRALKDSFTKTKGFPKHKKKMYDDSFTVPQKFRIGKKFVFIPKVGEVKWVKHRPIKGKVKHITISQEGDQWYCSVYCQLRVKNKQQVIDLEKLNGVDVGLKTYATYSDERVVKNPKTLKKHEKKLKRMQRSLSRKEKGSNNRNKAKKKLSRQHRRIRNIRKDFLHKETHHAIAKYDGIVREDLCIQGMMKNHHLAKAVADCAWYEFGRQLDYKAKWSQKPSIKIDRFEPSSKTCSCCGWIDEDLTLADRVFHCENCGLTLDRDLNAAINIKQMGIRILLDTQKFPNLVFKVKPVREMGGFRASARCPSATQEQKKVSTVPPCVV